MSRSKPQATKAANGTPQAREQLALSLYDVAPANGPSLNGERLGTFQDSLRAPIHRWFKYPAGYSYKLVEMPIDDFFERESLAA